jgi:hypothetical protein
MPGRLPTEREDVDSLAGITSQQAQDVLKAAAPTADKPALEQAAQAVQATAQGKPFPSAERQASQPTKITWIYAVNLATDPDWAQLAASGTGLVIAEDDPDAARLASLARPTGFRLRSTSRPRAGRHRKPTRAVWLPPTPSTSLTVSSSTSRPPATGTRTATPATIRTRTGGTGQRRLRP